MIESARMLFGGGSLIRLSCVAAMLFAQLGAVKAAVLLESPWETDSIYSTFSDSSSGPAKPVITRSPDPVCRGSTAMEFGLDFLSDGRGYRNELTLQGPYRNFKFGNEYWLGFAVFLPKTWAPDLASHRDLVLQFHGIPDRNASGARIEEYRNPNFSLRTAGDSWTVDTIWDSQSITTKGSYSGSKRYDLGTFQTGKWTEFVMRVKFTYAPGSDGILQVWKDGELLVNHSGPNAFNDKLAPYLKFGIYKAGWRTNTSWGGPSNVSSRLMYFDALRIGDASSSFKEVTPSCDQADAPSPPLLMQ